MANPVSQGDCVAKMKRMKADSIDFIFADPPYHLSNGGFSVKSGKQVSVHKGDWDKSRGLDDDMKFHLDWIEQAKRVLKPNGTIMISGTYHSIYRCGVALEKLGFRILNEIVWFKPNAAPNLAGRNFAAAHETIIWAAKSKKSKHTFNYRVMKEYEAPKDVLKNPGKQMRDVWVIASTPKREKLLGGHPTQKPLALLERIILATTKPGDKVLDPFSGSGTTGVAAKIHRRKFLGIELDKDYVELGNTRIREARAHRASKGR
jgi:site-specific DNA-methyltransferase (adenine-specific)